MLLLQISESKYEVDSSIFEEDFCKAILRNCSKVTPDMWLFLNISAPNCFIYITPECFGIKDFGNHSSYDYWSMFLPYYDNYIYIEYFMITRSPLICLLMYPYMTAI